MDPKKTQGAALRAWREEQTPRLSQYAAARRLAEFNEEHRQTTQGAWNAWEHGKKSPDLFFAFAIERMTMGRISAQGWAVARQPKTEKARAPESGTDVAASVAEAS